MEGYPKNNVTLGQDHGCACGSSCTCQSSCTCGASDFKDAEIYEYSLPRRVSAEFIELEEKERQERIAAGVNPMLYARIFRCQVELMHRHVPTSLLNDARSGVLSMKASSRGFASSFSNKFSGLRTSFANFANSWLESAKEKEAELEARAKPIINDLDARSQEFAVATNQKVEALKSSSTGLAQDAGNKLGDIKLSLRESAEFVGDRASGSFEDLKNKLNLNVDPSSRIAEERERARRMNEKVDPLVAARMGPVQRELIQTVSSK